MEHGVIQDYELSKYFNEKSSNEGYWISKYNLAVMILYEDPQNANRLIKELLAEGRSSPYILLGSIYHKGIGVERNDTEALIYYQIAVDNGFNEVRPIITSIYLRGKN